LNELWSDRLNKILIANPSELHFIKEVLHYDIQGLDCDLGYMHTLTPQIKEGIKFQRGIIAKLKPGKFPKSGN
jgi:hypothetical protein